MAAITAALVKELREKTGAGMMDCKKALNEANGDIEAAIDWLRTKGLAAAAKKSGRVAAEGLVGVASADKVAAMVEVNAETDFVARNESFQNFVESVAKVALKVGEDRSGKRGCGSTGIPRPLSRMVRRFSVSSRTSMVLAWPATASSMALSRISAARWCSALSSVPPIYMPGRRRTGSSPSRTSMALAS